MDLGMSRNDMEGIKINVVIQKYLIVGEVSSGRKLFTNSGALMACALLI